VGCRRTGGNCSLRNSQIHSMFLDNVSKWLRPGEKLISVITADARPTSGREPLWRLCRCPAKFASAQIPPKTYENGRLPGTSRRDAFTHGFRFVCNRMIELHRAG
jgi:hypothetical protein